ncbi:lytic transglycosylase domain-containing protein [Tomitella biformata]|uniref:lytic transglycosylase domain-containing protein n=1 Tax=Tomitella biformata TaxID=630403 RepID=UPI0004638939|nr:lytic murein transglycosylase [Tomitella biformata]
MAGPRTKRTSTLRRRSVWAASLAAPALLLGAASTLPSGPAAAPAAVPAEDTSAQLLSDATTIDPTATDAPIVDATATSGEPALAAPAVETTAPSSTPARPAGLPSDVRHGGVPDINYTAYRHAAELLFTQQPQCGIDWTLIAGIGRVESTHANNGAADADGNLLTPILGPVLDGSLRGNAVIKDTDGGELDGDASFDRAVGPTQFLPETWQAYAGDGNGDGEADPQNLFDAALTTGNYLCHGNLDLRNAADIAAAVLRYNNSQAYVNDVVGFAQQYAAH